MSRKLPTKTKKYRDARRQARLAEFASWREERVRAGEQLNPPCHSPGHCCMDLHICGDRYGFATSDQVRNYHTWHAEPNTPK